MKGRTIFAIVLAYLVPGAGHLYLGRRARAITFFCIVVVMFLIGIAIGALLLGVIAGLRAMTAPAAASWAAALGSLGSGVIYWIAVWMGVHGDVTSSTFEHGTAFTITAGLMNLLLVLDVFDIAQERKE